MAKHYFSDARISLITRALWRAQNNWIIPKGVAERLVFDFCTSAPHVGCFLILIFHPVIVYTLYSASNLNCANFQFEIEFVWSKYLRFKNSDVSLNYDLMSTICNHFTFQSRFIWFGSWFCVFQCCCDKYLHLFIKQL